MQTWMAGDGEGAVRSLAKRTADQAGVPRLACLPGVEQLLSRQGRQAALAAQEVEEGAEAAGETVGTGA